MLDAGIMIGSGELQDSPDGYRRESMYSKKGSMANKNKLSFLQGSILERKTGVNNYIEVEGKIQEVVEEED